MTNSIKIVAIFILLAMPIFANVFEHPLTDIKSADKIIHSPEKISGDFRQEKVMTSLGVTLKSEGKFAISKSQGIFWQNTKPLTNTTIINGERICSYSGGQLTTIDSAGNEMLQNMLNMINSVFTQDYDEMMKYFDLYFTELDGAYELGLRAKDAGLAAVIKQMRVSGSSYIESIEFSDASGDITTIYFSNIIENAENFSCTK